MDSVSSFPFSLNTSVPVHVEFGGEKRTLFLNSRMWIGCLKNLISELWSLEYEDIVLRDVTQEQNTTKIISNSPTLKSLLNRARNLQRDMRLKVSVKNVNAALLNKVEASYYACTDVENQNEVLVAGGTHGNERHCVNGVRLLRNYFARPEYPLVGEILNAFSLIVVPVINPIGYLANARGCPTIGSRKVLWESMPMTFDIEIDASVARVDDRHVHDCEPAGSIVIPEEERGATMPLGWADPNRPYPLTLAHLNLDRLINRRTMFAIFNHDWAIPLPIACSYSSEESAAKLSGLKQLLEFLQRDKWDGKVFESPRQLGTSNTTQTHQAPRPQSALHQMFARKSAKPEHNFFVNRTVMPEPETMGWHLWKQQGLENLLLESYIGTSKSALVHFTATLYSLAKLAQVRYTDEEIVEKILSSPPLASLRN
jgi:hypothetical protein